MKKEESDKVDLFSPIQISGVRIKNRIILPALILNYPVDGVHLDEAWKRYYRNRAEGGAGLMIVGACYVQKVGQMDQNQIGVDHDGWLPELEDIARVIKSGGAVPALQLNHGGRYSFKEVIGMTPVAPSAIASRYTGQTPRELSTGEVEEIIKCFADAAYRAKKAGFEAVELLGASGYLINQFCTPVTNHRKDRFGEGPEGRLTFVKEAIAGIKEKVGERFPLIYRLSYRDNVPGGLEAEDQREVARKLAQWGVHLINVTAGWHDSTQAQITSTLPQGYIVPYASKIKEEVKAAVSCAVRITKPDFARAAIAEGKLDMVALGRALIADPEWPLKAQRGDDDAIRYCICCMHCFDQSFKKKPSDCAINADLLGEKVRLASKTKKILVLGGGPAGMEAARVLAERGHRVVIYEKDEKLGGKLHLATVPPHKEEMALLVGFLSHELKRLGVSIKVNEAWGETVNGFDGIIIAAGAKERKINIQGMGSIPCYTSSEVLSGRAQLKSPVVIVGAGLVGGETAHHLSSKGFQVSLVEIQERAFADMGVTTRWPLMESLKKAGVAIYTSSEVREVRKGEVVIQGKEGERKLPVMCLIQAVGFATDNELVDKVKKTGIPYCVIGDHLKPRRIKDAIHEGYTAATTWVDGLD